MACHRHLCTIAFLFSSSSLVHISHIKPIFLKMSQFFPFTSISHVSKLPKASFPMLSLFICSFLLILLNTSLLSSHILTDLLATAFTSPFDPPVLLNHLSSFLPLIFNFLCFPPFHVFLSLLQRIRIIYIRLRSRHVKAKH